MHKGLLSQESIGIAFLWTVSIAAGHKDKIEDQII